MKGPTLKDLAKRFASFDRKKLDETWTAIHKKREQLGNTRFPSYDPRSKSVDRLAKASKAVLAAKDTLEKSTQTGARGGKFYIAASGEKVYVK